MSITLGGIELNGSLQWIDRYQSGKIAMTTKRSLAGNLFVYSQPLDKGTPITLQATIDTGWFTMSMVDSLLVLNALSNVTHVLGFHGEIHDVMFNEVDALALSFSSLEYRVPLLPDSRFIGTIRLFTV